MAWTFLILVSKKKIEIVTKLLNLDQIWKQLKNILSSYKWYVSLVTLHNFTNINVFTVWSATFLNAKFAPYSNIVTIYIYIYIGLWCCSLKTYWSCNSRFPHLFLKKLTIYISVIIVHAQIIIYLWNSTWCTARHIPLVLY